MRFDEPAVFVTDRVEAAAMWLPPGEPELAPDHDARLPEILRELEGDRVDDLMELMERFERAQPADPPHYYLSLLGVHDDHRGKGIGMRLHADNLERLATLAIEGAPIAGQPIDAVIGIGDVAVQRGRALVLDRHTCMGATGLEPVTSSLSSWRSPN